MIKKNIFQNLFIFEIANNHMGDVEHGLRIIREIQEISKDFNFTFGFKLQYRDIDTFIHPEYRERKDLKYVKRFLETQLSVADFKLLVNEIKKMGFVAVCTPFDERSVDLIEKHSFDIIKIGSCSLTDWPLLERVVKTDKPIIASTAAASLEDIDKVVMFLEHREKQFSLMHCVGEYPTLNDNLQLNQIDLLRQRYPECPIGYSTHEDPGNYDAIKIAIAKGATIFEKHVGIENEKYPLNSYSATPEVIRKWLEVAQGTFEMCGVSGQRRSFSEKEKTDLKGLQRGVFAKTAIKKGQKLDISNIFLAIPNTDNQILANGMSKYKEFIANKDIRINQPILFDDINVKNLRERILEIINNIKPILIESRVFLPNKLELEISHHYGIENFEQWGAVLINCINREYCKKLIILLAGQSHPVHYHAKKEETFNILYGSLTINISGQEKEYKPGEIVTIERGIKHGFSCKNGTVFEEVSTTSLAEDSFYEDQQIEKNEVRKTYMTFWQDWLSKPIS
ncbi:MAG: N-acetylneuraminate synthase family protein [Candidatus Omnitrophota bacterium]|nr:N-acetylneuraminate synthase family protein [Candidatus Omnitrophota bacterium]